MRRHYVQKSTLEDFNKRFRYANIREDPWVKAFFDDLKGGKKFRTRRDTVVVTPAEKRLLLAIQRVMEKRREKGIMREKMIWREIADSYEKLYGKRLTNPTIIQTRSNLENKGFKFEQVNVSSLGEEVLIDNVDRDIVPLYGKISQAKIAAKLGVGQATVNRRIQRLRKSGLIE